MMRSSIVPSVCSLIVVLMTCSAATAEEKLGGQVFASPQAVLDAYTKAIADRDWPTIFALGTSTHQDEQMLEIVGAAISSSQILGLYGPALAKDPGAQVAAQAMKVRNSEIQAIMARHVVDWGRLSASERGRKIAGAIHNLPEVRARAAADIAGDIKDKAGLFAEMHRLGGGPRSTPQMRLVSQDGSTATAEMTSTINLIEATRDQRTNAMIRTETTVEQTETVHLRQIAGRWYVSAKDEWKESPVPGPVGRTTKSAQEIPEVARPPQDPPAAQVVPHY